MGHVNTQLDNLYTFIKNVAYKGELQTKLNKIEMEIERLDQTERLGVTSKVL